MRLETFKTTCVIGVAFGKSTDGQYRREEIAGPVGRVGEIVDDGVFLRYL